MKGFLDIYNELKNFIFSNMMPVNQELAVKYLDEFLNNSFNLGIIGFISILYTSIMFFYNFDSIVVKIFDTKRRDFWHSLTIYWTLVTLTPIALSLSFFISYQIQDIIEYYTSWINLTVIIPYFIIWGLFFIIYRVVPNKDIYNTPTLISSFVASFVWYMLKSLFVYYAFYSKSYTSVYGPFAIALFFFIWINISWLILLYGLKLLRIMNNYNIKDLICK
jgi:membrane protein